MNASPQRIALGVEYDGTDYAGWQRQPGTAARTLQAELERALSRVADAPVSTVCAGRTDAGVHASAQVVHFDTVALRSPRSWVLGPNSLLPPAIAVRWACPVEAGFSARFSARYRRYRYRILNRPVRSPLLARHSCLWRHPLDAGAMRAAGATLHGEHDFSAFRGAGCQSRSAMRHVDFVRVEADGDTICVDVQANAFLLHMVRNIVGVLLCIGSGERPVGWATEVLAGRDRRLGAPTAPACGLELVEVGYDASWGLPATPGAGDGAGR